MSRNAILLGHFVAMFLIIFAQMSLLVLFGQLLFAAQLFQCAGGDLLPDHHVGFLFSASLGLLIGVQAKSEEQVVMYALVAMFVLAALGGAMAAIGVYAGDLSAYCVYDADSVDD